MQTCETIQLVAFLLKGVEMRQETFFLILIDYLRDCDFDSGVYGRRWIKER